MNCEITSCFEIIHKHIFQDKHWSGYCIIHSSHFITYTQFHDLDIIIYHAKFYPKHKQIIKNAPHNNVSKILQTVHIIIQEELQ